MRSEAYRADKIAQLNTRLLASYVPKLLLRKYQLNPFPVHPPTIERGNACVLFADISGFTPLTEKFSALGSRGIEEMTVHLNNFFDELIGLIHTYGGDIIKFAGDALIALWVAKPDGSNLGRHVNLACQCALAMQNELNQYVVGDCILRLHMGIGAGPISFLHLGGGGVSERMEFLFTGDPLDQAAQGEGEALPGEVSISKQAARLIQKQLKTKTRRKKKRGEPIGKTLMLHEVRLPEPPQPADYLPQSYHEDIRPYLSPYIPVTVTHRLSDLTKPIENSGEIRIVNVVFLNLDFVYTDNVNEMEKLQFALHSMETKIYDLGGVLRQFLVDDKGSVLIAAFGLPPESYENNSVRAVTCAIEMQKDLQTLGMRSRVGVTTGPAFCGDVGNLERREYAMVGDIVNLSARLMGASPWDGVLVCKTTYQLCIRQESKLQFIELEPINVKGKSHKIEIYSPQINSGAAMLLRMRSRKSRMFTSSRTKVSGKYSKIELYGRDNEIKQLHDIFDQMKATTETNVVVLEGEAGIGKSRLVDSLSKYVRMRGTPYYTGSCNSIENMTPYFPFTEILTQILSLHEAPTTSADSDLRGYIEEWIMVNLPLYEGYAPLLNDILPLEWEDTDETELLEGTERTTKLRELLLAMIHASPSPRVIVIDNAQWCDFKSWSLIYRIYRKIPTTMLVIVSRYFDQIPVQITKFRESRNTHFIDLGGLDDDSIMAIVRDRLGLNILHSDIVDDILPRIGSIPLIAEEMADSIKDSNVLESYLNLNHSVKDEKRKRIGSLVSSQAVSKNAALSSMNSVFTSKLDKLSKSQRIVINVASVIGSQFPLMLLYDILPIKAEALVIQNTNTSDDLAVSSITDEENAFSELSDKNLSDIITDSTTDILFSLTSPNLVDLKASTHLDAESEVDNLGLSSIIPINSVESDSDEDIPVSTKEKTSRNVEDITQVIPEEGAVDHFIFRRKRSEENADSEDTQSNSSHSKSNTLSKTISRIEIQIEESPPVQKRKRDSEPTPKDTKKAIKTSVKNKSKKEEIDFILTRKQELTVSNKKRRHQSSRKQSRQSSEDDEPPKLNISENASLALKVLDRQRERQSKAASYDEQALSTLKSKKKTNLFKKKKRKSDKKLPTVEGSPDILLQGSARHRKRRSNDKEKKPEELRRTVRFIKPSRESFADGHSSEVLGSEEGIKRLQIILDELIKLKVLDKQSEDLYCFRQLMFQQVAKNIILNSNREELHRKIALWYETKEDLKPLYSVLAYHWKSAGDDSKYKHYSKKASVAVHF